MFSEMKQSLSFYCSLLPWFHSTSPPFCPSFFLCLFSFSVCVHSTSSLNSFSMYLSALHFVSPPHIPASLSHNLSITFSVSNPPPYMSLSFLLSFCPFSVSPPFHSLCVSLSFCLSFPFCPLSSLSPSHLSLSLTLFHSLKSAEWTE